jgi:hypothetical protein
MEKELCLPSTCILLNYRFLLLATELWVAFSVPQTAMASHTKFCPKIQTLGENHFTFYEFILGHLGVDHFPEEASGMENLCSHRIELVD